MNITCPQCNKSIFVMNSLAGKKVKCQCGAIVAVPAAQEPAGKPMFKPGSLKLPPKPQLRPGLKLRGDAKSDVAKSDVTPTGQEDSKTETTPTPAPTPAPAPEPPPAPAPAPEPAPEPEPAPRSQCLSQRPHLLLLPRPLQHQHLRPRPLQHQHLRPRPRLRQHKLLLPRLSQRRNLLLLPHQRLQRRRRWPISPRVLAS